MAKPKSQPCWFRHDYLADNLSSVITLQHAAGLSKKETAEFLGITPRTYRRWTKNKAPDWARLLLAMKAGHIPWDGWKNWQMQDEGVMPPGYRYSVKPGEIIGMFYRMQQIAELKRQIRDFNAMDDQVAFIKEVLPQYLGKDGKQEK